MHKKLTGEQVLALYNALGAMEGRNAFDEDGKAVFIPYKLGMMVRLHCALNREALKKDAVAIIESIDGKIRELSGGKEEIPETVIDASGQVIPNPALVTFNKERKQLLALEYDAVLKDVNVDQFNLDQNEGLTIQMVGALLPMITQESIQQLEAATESNEPTTEQQGES